MKDLLTVVLVMGMLALFVMALGEGQRHENYRQCIERGRDHCQETFYP
jgi:hypothetical protein